jgi:predicted hexulose-6-phosphate isomerase
LVLLKPGTGVDFFAIQAIWFAVSELAFKHQGGNILDNINGCLLGLYEKALPDDLDWDERLSIAKAAGYDFVEISVDETDERLARVKWPEARKEELAGIIRASNMPVLTMCLSGNRKYPIGSENKDIRQKGIRLIKDSVDFSLAIGIRIVQLAGYDEYYNETNEKTKALFMTALQEVVEYAAAKGVSLAIETVDTPLMDSIEKAMTYVKRIHSPYLQVYPDVGNIAAMGKDVEKDFLSGAGHIMAIHLKDTKPGITRNIPYGEGIVDFVSFFKLIRSMDYKGLLVAEMWATDDRQSSIEYVKTASEFLIEKYREAEADDNQPTIEYVKTAREFQIENYREATADENK